MKTSISVNQTAEEKLCADLISAMEAGVNPWRKPWKAEQGQHRNPVSGAVYSGANPIILELAMALRGSDLPLWMGYGQAKSNGWFPRKGCKAATILRPEVHRREEADENGEKTEYVWTSYRTVNVFNAIDLQGDGLSVMIDTALGSVPTRPVLERLEAAEAVLKAWEVQPSIGGSRAFYVPSSDQICLPSPERFVDSAAFVATWAHEAIHSTGHPKRLKRDLSGGMGSRSYAQEELVAELGAFLLCRRLEVNSCPENHAAYLAHWAAMLHESPRVLMKVLSDARKAADLISG
jgi:antirestriction protein ArdC